MTISRRITSSIMLLLIALMLMSGCQTKIYALEDGRYMQQQVNAEDPCPYLLIHEGRFTVVMSIAVSYQPSGPIERNGNRITMHTIYGHKSCTWVFELISDNQLKYLADQSLLPFDENNWKDGILLTLVRDQ